MDGIGGRERDCFQCGRPMPWKEGRGVAPAVSQPLQDSLAALPNPQESFVDPIALGFRSFLTDSRRTASTRCRGFQARAFYTGHSERRKLNLHPQSRMRILCADGPAMHGDRALRDRKPQSHTAAIPVAIRLHPEKRLEQIWQALFGHTRTKIPYRGNRLAVPLL